MLPNHRRQVRYCLAVCQLSLQKTPRQRGHFQPNGEPLPIPNGAPLRLRLERQLGYKMAKYVMRLEVVEDFSKIARGKGGYWEDHGYEWYAGI